MIDSSADGLDLVLEQAVFDDGGDVDMEMAIDTLAAAGDDGADHMDMDIDLGNGVRVLEVSSSSPFFNTRSSGRSVIHSSETTS